MAFERAKGPFDVVGAFFDREAAFERGLPRLKKPPQRWLRFPAVRLA